MPQILKSASTEAPRKIKVQISKLAYDQVLLDVEDYELRSASALYIHLCALTEGVLPADLRTGNDDDGLPQESISFTLPATIAGPFIAACIQHKVGAAAAVRALLYAYVAKSRCLREETVRSAEVTELQGAIRRRKRIALEYKGKNEELEPCFIAHSQGMARAYLVAYDTRRQEFRCLRLAHIRHVQCDDRPAYYLKEPSLSKRAKDLRKNFDPFLSYGHSVKVRLSKAGAEHMRRATTNRPICSTQSLQAGVHEFRCAPLQAQLYFAAFIDEVEILEPKELREWFQRKLELAAAMYR